MNGPSRHWPLSHLEFFLCDLMHCHGINGSTQVSGCQRCVQLLSWAPDPRPQPFAKQLIHIPHGHLKVKLDLAWLHNCLLPACLPVKSAIQSFELDACLWSAIIPLPLCPVNLQILSILPLKELLNPILLFIATVLSLLGASLSLLRIITAASFLVILPKPSLTSVQSPVSYQIESINLILLFIC